MATVISRFIEAPIEDVFSFFDDPSSTLEFNPHAVRFELVDQQPDGRRTYDVASATGHLRSSVVANRVRGVGTPRAGRR